MDISSLSRAEENLLLYLETQLVDHGGLVLSDSMNCKDFAMAQRWVAAGLITFGRRPLRDVPTSGAGAGRYHRVHFSSDAWTAAHALRRIRAERNAYDVTGATIAPDVAAKNGAVEALHTGPGSRRPGPGDPPAGGVSPPPPAGLDPNRGGSAADGDDL